MGTEIRYVVSYACPHCRATLEGRSEHAGSWLRCPGCGRASRPPAEALVVADRTPPPPLAEGEDALVIDAPPPLRAMTPVAVNRGDDRDDETPGGVAEGTPTVNPWRVVLTTALFVSISMLLFAFLDRSPYGVPLFVTATVVCVVLLLIPRRAES